jgi:hypothetical protein
MTSSEVKVTGSIVLYFTTTMYTFRGSNVISFLRGVLPIMVPNFFQIRIKMWDLQYINNHENGAVS